MPEPPAVLCDIRAQRSQYAELWWQSDGQRLPDLPAHSESDQSTRESDVAHFLELALGEVERLPTGAHDLEPAEGRMLAAAEQFLFPALDLDRRHLTLVARSGFRRGAVEFVQKARQFDPLLSEPAIFQASRNAWTMYTLQLLFGLPVRLTSAVLGYSLIYPYSDNLLDDPSIDAETKVAFNERLSSRLAGERPSAEHPREVRIWELVRMIEDQYARDRFPAVYDSLLAIQAAQAKSVSLLQRRASPYEVDLLGTALEKGGASVLADGLLVTGRLTCGQQEFLFGLGALLQLVDDLQDVTQNRREGLLTIFSQTARRWPLDELTTRTFRFGQRILEKLASFGTPEAVPLQQLTERTVTVLLLDAAQRARSYHTRAYMKELERLSPVRFSFMRRSRATLARRHGLLLAWLEAVVGQERLDPAPGSAAAGDGSQGIPVTRRA